MTTAAGSTINYTYDDLKRLAGEVVRNDGTALFSTYYSYRTISGQRTSAQVYDRNIFLGATTATSSNVIFGERFTYDALGNIIAIHEGYIRTGNTTRRQLAAYEYDSQNQLTKETRYNYTDTTTTPGSTDIYTYTYDTAGNILSESKNGVPTKTYTYGNSTWGDLLTKYNTMNITYDEIGNPIYYANSHALYSFTWVNGRTLATASVDDDDRYELTFDYDSDGIRSKKTVGNTVHEYITQNGKVVRETIKSGNRRVRTYDFIYDASGKPFALIQTNLRMSPVTYYYVLNLQGDVVGLVDANGNYVAKYTYNAWGEVLSVTDEDGAAITSSSHVANLNPLRYRGYYYDSETGFYYVSSRYYDPEIGRWINADNVIPDVGVEVLGHNMFAYCMNNPINMVDPLGNWPKWIETAAKIASAVVAVTAAVVMVTAVSAVSAGTAGPAAIYGASIFLGAALSGINGGVANEAKGNSYINGYIGGATGGTIQAACSTTPVGTILGGGVGVCTGTIVTDVMNNIDPDSTDSSVRQIASNAIRSGAKALATSSLTAFIGNASDLATTNGANGLMPAYGLGFGESVKAFFGWLDDAMVYLLN